MVLHNHTNFNEASLKTIGLNFNMCACDSGQNVSVTWCSGKSVTNIADVLDSFAAGHGRLKEWTFKQPALEDCV